MRACVIYRSLGKDWEKVIGQWVKLRTSNDHCSIEDIASISYLQAGSESIKLYPNVALETRQLIEQLMFQLWMSPPTSIQPRNAVNKLSEILFGKLLVT